jgi:hypothetical protein
MASYKSCQGPDHKGDRRLRTARAIGQARPCGNDIYCGACDLKRRRAKKDNEIKNKPDNKRQEAKVEQGNDKGAESESKGEVKGGLEQATATITLRSRSRALATAASLLLLASKSKN